MATYNFTATNTNDGKGGLGTSITYNSGVGSSTTPVTLVTGDILSITVPANGGPIQAFPEAGEFGGTSPDRIVFDLITTSSTKTLTIQNVATNNVVGRILVQGYANVYIYFRIVGDSIPSTPSVTNLTNQSLSTSVQQSFVVAGLGSGKACGFITDLAEIKVNSGAWQPQGTPVKVVNGNTVYVRHTTSDQYETRIPVGLAGLDLSGPVTVADFFSETIVSPTSNYGVTTFASDGSVQLNMSSRLGRLYQTGSFNITVTSATSGGTGEATTTISVPGMDTSDNWVILDDVVVSDTVAYYGYANFTQGTNQMDVTITVNFKAGYSSTTATVNYKVVLGG